MINCTFSWEQRKVSDLFKITRGYVLSALLTSEDKNNDAPYPVYSSQTKNNGLMGYYKDYLYEDAITWTTDGANAGTVNYRTGKFYCTNVCGVLLNDKMVPNLMIAEALGNVSKSHVSYVGNPKLMNNVMADIDIKIPLNLEEQRKISELFSEIDSIITLHQRKLDKLVQLKSSFLEKMFPTNGCNKPQIRFKGFSDAWEQRKLESVALYRNGKAHEQSICLDGKYIVVNSKFVSTNGKTIKYSNEQIEPLFKDEIAFVLSDVPNGKAIARTFLIDKNDLYTLNQRIAGITPIRNTDPYFLYKLMNRHQYFLNFDDGVKQTNLTVADVLEFEAKYPAPPEQKKIGLLFKAIDNAITLHQRKLEMLKNLKSSLLEKMFV